MKQESYHHFLLALTSRSIKKYFIYTAEIVSTILGNTVTFEFLPVHQLDYSREVKKEVIKLNVKDRMHKSCFAKRNKTKCNSL